LTQVEFNCEKKKEFYIGRKQGSDIELPETEISREQAMIYYEKDNWYIKDGGKEKPSGSGTWLFLEKRYEITNNIIFMVGSSTIKLEYNPPQTDKENKEDKENNSSNLEAIKTFLRGLCGEGGRKCRDTVLSFLLCLNTFRCKHSLRELGLNYSTVKQVLSHADTSKGSEFGILIRKD